MLAPRKVTSYIAEETTGRSRGFILSTVGECERGLNSKGIRCMLKKLVLPAHGGVEQWSGCLGCSLTLGEPLDGSLNVHKHHLPTRLQGRLRSLEGAAVGERFYAVSQEELGGGFLLWGGDLRPECIPQPPSAVFRGDGILSTETIGGSQAWVLTGIGLAGRGTRIVGDSCPPVPPILRCCLLVPQLPLGLSFSGSTSSLLQCRAPTCLSPPTSCPPPQPAWPCALCPALLTSCLTC